MLIWEYSTDGGQTTALALINNLPDPVSKYQLLIDLAESRRQTLQPAAHR
jgi:hypothetical protein